MQLPRTATVTSRMQLTLRKEELDAIGIKYRGKVAVWVEGISICIASHETYKKLRSSATLIEP